MLGMMVEMDIFKPGVLK